MVLYALHVLWKISTEIIICNELKEMGGACSAYGGGERCVQGFGGET